MVDETYNIGLYKVDIEIDIEEDNQKAFTEVTTPDGNRHLLDITPYWPSKELILKMVQFHEKYGWFLSRQEIGSSGSVNIDDLDDVTETLKKFD